MTPITTGRRLLTVTAALFCLSSAATAEEVQSSTLVKHLTSVMTERQLDSVAAADPAKPGRFVAALLLPGVQLLVVAAEYPNPAELQALLAQRNYRDVYSALHQPSTQQSRIFFLDAGCDGLRTGSDAVDVLYEKGAAETLFDGNWKKSGLSQTAYEQKVQEANGQFSQLVTLLRTALQPASGGDPPAR